MNPNALKRTKTRGVLAILSAIGLKYYIYVCFVIFWIIHGIVLITGLHGPKCLGLKTMKVTLSEEIPLLSMVSSLFYHCF